MPKKNQRSLTLSGEDLKKLEKYYKDFKAYCFWNKIPSASFPHFLTVMAENAILKSDWYNWYHGEGR